MPEKSRKYNGYIAVTSAVIMTAIILAIVGVVSLAAYTSRFNVLGGELKERTHAFAEACMDAALLALVQNPAYAGSEIIAVSGSDTCEILPVESAGAERTVKARATVAGAMTNISMTVNPATRAIVSWEEVAQF